MAEAQPKCGACIAILETICKHRPDPEVCTLYEKYVTENVDPVAAQEVMIDLVSDEDLEFAVNKITDKMEGD